MSGNINDLTPNKVNSIINKNLPEFRLSMEHVLIKLEDALQIIRENSKA